MKKISQLLIILLASIVLSHCAFSGNNSWDSQVSGPLGMPEETRHLVQKLITNSKKAGNKTGLTITYPFDGTVFPPEIAAPVIVWQDAGSASKHWLIIVEFRSRLSSPIYALVDKQHWMPDKTIWEIIKANDDAQFKDQLSYYNLAKTHAVRRTSPNFWEEADWHYKKYLKDQPIEVGLFDMYRFNRIALKSDAQFKW